MSRKPGPRSNPGWLRAGLSQTIWSHRCFHIKSKGSGWFAKNVFPALAPDLPASFQWTVKEDREGLKVYIDALLAHRRTETIAIEEQGAVTDIEVFHYDRPNDTIIRVKVARFIDYMLLRDEFDIPLWGKVHFITDGNNVVPREFIASIGQLLGENGKFISPDRPWRHCTEKDLTAMGLTPNDVTSSMYADQYPGRAIDPGVMDTEGPDAEPREIEMSREVYDRHVDLTTRVEPVGERPYFARRIMTLRGVLLWSGTSYQLHGPWKVWTRETSQLLALGLDL